jgi:transposase InsO family protein
MVWRNSPRPSPRLPPCASWPVRLVSTCRASGRPLRRVLTDQGSAYRGAFHRTSAELGIAHTRTPPRHARTNGFAERLYGTVLSKLVHIEPALAVGQGPPGATSSPACPRCRPHSISISPSQDCRAGYNHQRSHQGYRTQGRTSGEIFTKRETQDDTTAKA